MEHFEIGKLLAASLGAALIAAGCTGCGVSTGGGFVVGTTGYLQEFNRGQRQAAVGENITQSDRSELAALVQRNTAAR